MRFNTKTIWTLYLPALVVGCMGGPMIGFEVWCALFVLRLIFPRGIGG